MSKKNEKGANLAKKKNDKVQTFQLIKRHARTFSLHCFEQYQKC